MISWLDLLKSECKGKFMTKPKNHKTDRAVAKWTKTSEEILVESGRVAIGSEYKAFETSNFGWLVFAPQTKLNNGAILYKRIYRY